MSDQDDRNPRAVIGGNNPPAPTREERHKDYVDSVNELAAKATAVVNSVPKVTTSKEAETFVELVKLARTKKALGEDVRLSANRPLNDEIKANNSFFKDNLGGRLDRIISVLSSRVEAYHDAQREAERRRLADEAAERHRLAEEERARTQAALAEGGVEAELAGERQGRLDNAAQASAARATSDFGPVRTEAGTIGTVRGYDFKVPDYEALDLNELKNSFGVDAIDKAIRDHIRKHKDKKPLKGVNVFESSKINIR